jgi:superfamily I DNA/RNA helicase
VILKKLVEELIRKDRVHPDNIVVLSPYRYDNKRLGIKKLIDGNPGIFSLDVTQKGQDKIRVSTIQSFKGLEADVVILCGIDGHQPACKPSILYVGATRARSMLYVIQNQNPDI